MFFTSLRGYDRSWLRGDAIAAILITLAYIAFGIRAVATTPDVTR